MGRVTRTHSRTTVAAGCTFSLKVKCDSSYRLFFVSSHSTQIAQSNLLLLLFSFFSFLYRQVKPYRGLRVELEESHTASDLAAHYRLRASDQTDGSQLRCKQRVPAVSGQARESVSHFGGSHAGAYLSASDTGSAIVSLPLFTYFGTTNIFVILFSYVQYFPLILFYHLLSLFVMILTGVPADRRI